MHVDASEYCSAKRNRVKTTPDFLSLPSNPKTRSRKDCQNHNDISHNGTGDSYLIRSTCRCLIQKHTMYIHLRRKGRECSCQASYCGNLYKTYHNIGMAFKGTTSKEKKLIKGKRILKAWVPSSHNAPSKSNMGRDCIVVGYVTKTSLNPTWFSQWKLG